jgi:hypothetical protein
VAGGWRRLYNMEFHNLFVSLNIIRVIKPRRVRWTGHIACMKRKAMQRLLVGKI